VDVEDRIEDYRVFYDVTPVFAPEHVASGIGVAGERP
jgi:hypothetical protein